MNNEIDWLCYVGVQNGLYTPEQVKALYDISPEGTSLMDFAQGTLDNGFTNDVGNLQIILEQASNFANEQGPCPHSVLQAPGAAPAAAAVRVRAVRRGRAPAAVAAAVGARGLAPWCRRAAEHARDGGSDGARHGDVRGRLPRRRARASRGVWPHRGARPGDRMAGCVGRCASSCPRHLPPRPQA